MKTESAAVTGAGQAVAGPCTVYSVTFLASAGGVGVIQVRDGGVAGAIKAYLGAPVSEAAPTAHFHGMGFLTDVWITGANIGGVTVEYMPD